MPRLAGDEKVDPNHIELTVPEVEVRDTATPLAARQRNITEFFVPTTAVQTVQPSVPAGTQASTVSTKNKATKNETRHKPQQKGL